MTLEQINHKCIGQLEDEYFTYPINYEQAQELLDFFVSICLYILERFKTLCIHRTNFFFTPNYLLHST